MRGARNELVAPAAASCRIGKGKYFHTHFTLQSSPIPYCTLPSCVLCRALQTETAPRPSLLPCQPAPPRNASILNIHVRHGRTHSGPHNTWRPSLHSMTVRIEAYTRPDFKISCTTTPDRRAGDRWHETSGKDRSELGSRCDEDWRRHGMSIVARAAVRVPSSLEEAGECRVGARPSTRLIREPTLERRFRILRRSRNSKSTTSMRDMRGMYARIRVHTESAAQ